MKYLTIEIFCLLSIKNKKFPMQNLILPFLSIMFVWAGEVDQYMAGNQLPNDESHYLNQLFNEKIQNALDDINETDPDCSCAEAAGNVLKYFGIGLNSPLEKHVKNAGDFDKYPNDDIPFSERYKKSIFRREVTSKNIDQYQNYSLWLQIDEVINVAGIYIGVDKLTHFTASGYLYYQIYNLALEQTKHEKAISIGIYGEKNILGKIPSGVFSYADLESNFQGLLFTLDLCCNGQSRLVRDGIGWSLSTPFDIKHYVNPYWDEAYNPSYYYEGPNLSLLSKAQTVMKNIPHYCLLYKTQRIQKIFTYYDRIAEPSFSVLYLKELVDEGELPDPTPFDIRLICGN